MIVRRVQGDRRMPLTGQVRNIPPATLTEVPMNLTGCSLKIFGRLGATLKIDGTPTVTDPTDGRWSYEWGATDLDTEGVIRMELQVTFGDGKPLTLPAVAPFELRIRKQLN